MGLLRRLSSALMMLLALGHALQPVALADEVCWKASQGRKLTLPVRCNLGDEKDPTGALCYPPTPAGYSCVGPVCSASCPNGFTDRGLLCERPPVAYLSTGGEPVDALLSRCRADGNPLCLPVQGVVLAAGACRPGAYRTLQGLCLQPCPDGYPDLGPTCGKPPPRGRTAGYVPKCAPGAQNAGGVCYSPCPDGYTGQGPLCIVNACGGATAQDCGAMCGSSQAACAKAGLNMGFSIIQAVLQIGAMALTAGGSAAATTVNNVAGSIGGASGIINLGFTLDPATQSALQSASSNTVGAVNSLASNTLIDTNTLGSAVGVGTATNVLSWAINTAASGQFDPRSLLSLDPTGLGAVALSFWLPTCPMPQGTAPVTQLHIADKAGQRLDYLEFVGQDGAVYQARLTSRKATDFASQFPSLAGEGNYDPRQDPANAAYFSDAGQRTAQQQVAYQNAVGQPTGAPLYPVWSITRPGSPAAPDEAPYLVVKAMGWVDSMATVDWSGHFGGYGVYWGMLGASSGASLGKGPGDVIVKRPGGGLWKVVMNQGGFDYFRVTVTGWPEAVWVSPDGAVTTDHFRYVDGDGNLWSARRVNGQFQRSPRGSNGAFSPVQRLDYMGWDTGTASIQGAAFGNCSVRGRTGAVSCSGYIDTYDWTGDRIRVGWSAADQQFVVLNPDRQFPGQQAPVQAVPAAAAPAAAAVPDPRYALGPKHAQGMCLRPAAPPAPGVALVIGSCRAGSPETFAFSAYHRAPGQTVLMHVASGLCVTVRSHNGTPSPVILDTCNQADQLWTKQPAGELRNLTYGTCLDVQGWGRADGTPVLSYTCNGGDNQRYAEWAMGR